MRGKVSQPISIIIKNMLGYHCLREAECLGKTETYSMYSNQLLSESCLMYFSLFYQSKQRSIDVTKHSPAPDFANVCVSF